MRQTAGGSTGPRWASSNPFGVDETIMLMRQQGQAAGAVTMDGDENSLPSAVVRVPGFARVGAPVFFSSFLGCL